jgi:uncharacterized repeat protein (TIGR03803 family)
MQPPNSWLRITRSLAGFVVILLFVGLFVGRGIASAPRERVIYSFQGGTDGTNPSTALITDQAGNLFGTTTEGGSGSCTGGCGTVFELKPASNGSWTETVLYNFQGGNDGAAPAAGLVFDQAGNLYGTTIGGGPSLDGTVFQLMRSGTSWTETVVHRFTGSDGAYPVDSLIFDDAGNLYGTTVFGGRFNDGTVFQLAPSGGTWTESVLYDFTGRNDGIDPEAGLILDQKGALYGTTIAGNVFRLTPPASGDTKWSLKVIYAFDGGVNRGQLSAGTLLAGKNGVLYGTQKFGGGPANAGAVYQLTPPATHGGAWTETTIYRFTGGADGAYPFAGVIADSAGNLYGTTSGNGRANQGTVFQLTPPASQGAAWTETTLHAFSGGSDGSGPGANLIVGKAGALYSTTAGGGSSGKGTIFKIVR